jgi:hypothetical protein
MPYPPARDFRLLEGCTDPLSALAGFEPGTFGFLSSSIANPLRISISGVDPKSKEGPTTVLLSLRL